MRQIAIEFLNEDFQAIVEGQPVSGEQVCFKCGREISQFEQKVSVPNTDVFMCIDCHIKPE